MSDEQERGLKSGRYLSVLKRVNPQLYVEVKEIAKSRGIKMHEALEEALTIWKMYQSLEGIDPRALVSALTFIEHMFDVSIRMLVQLSQIFTTEWWNSQMMLIQQLQQQAQQQEQPKAVSEPSMKSQVRAMMMPILMGLIQQLMSSLMTMLSGMKIGVPTQTLPTQTTQSQTQSSGKQIIVEE